MTLRETGSIVVGAPRDRVIEVVRERLADAEGFREVGDDRLETDRATFVFRDVPGGTRVVHARATPGIAFPPARKLELRQAVADELLAVQKLVLTEGR